METAKKHLLLLIFLFHFDLICALAIIATAPTAVIFFCIALCFVRIGAK